MTDLSPAAGAIDDFAAHLERARASGRPLLDLTETDPERCGLGWDATELGAILSTARAAAREGAEQPLSQARDAVASYLAGRGASVPPERVRFTRSRRDGLRLILKLLCDAEDEVLVASPSRHPGVEELAASAGRVARYALAYDAEWHLDARAMAKAVTRRTRAIVLGNPSEPTGAMLGREDLALLEDLCASRGVALVADEAFVDTALAPAATVLAATRCLSFQLSGLSGVCGLPELGAEWVAVAGPDELVAPALVALAPVSDAPSPEVAASVQLAVPALLARRACFLVPLRARLAGNRASLATGALRESAWSLAWGRGGCWAVLQIGAAEDDDALCRALLEEDDVAVQPGSAYRLPPGHLVVSLLPPPDVFSEALSRLDRRLRAPLAR